MIMAQTKVSNKSEFASTSEKTADRLEFSAIRIEIGRLEDLNTIADFQLAMALETENEHLDLETVRKGILYIFNKNNNIASDSANPFYLIARHATLGPVGCLMVQSEWSDWRNGNVWWIHSVYLKPEARGIGLFRAFYTHVETQAKSLNVRGLRLFVDKRNTNAQKIYAAVGMTAEHYDLYERLF